MKRSQFPNRFDFYDDYAFDDEVEAMSADELTSITDFNRLLFFRQQMTMPQCNDEGSMVNGLNESRPKLFVNVDCRSDDLVDHSLDLRCDRRQNIMLVVPFVVACVFLVLFVIVAFFFVPFVLFVVLVFVLFVLFVVLVLVLIFVVHRSCLRVFVVAFSSSRKR